jgi:hypothetical protein
MTGLLTYAQFIENQITSSVHELMSDYYKYNRPVEPMTLVLAVINLRSQSDSISPELNAVINALDPTKRRAMFLKIAKGIA